MNAAARSARAGLLLASLLFAAALPPPAPEAQACADPAEHAAREGHTREVGCGGGAALRGPAQLLFGELLDPNSADARTLAVLPGIGPSRAAAIVAARPYASVAELARVPGIGPRTLARISPLLVVQTD